MSTTFEPGAQLAVLSQSGCTLNFFDLTTQTRTAQLDVLPEGHELCFDPRTRLLYASHTYRSGVWLAHAAESHEITVVDVDSHEIVDVLDISPEHAPHGMHIDGDVLYASVEEGPSGPGGLLAIDLRTRRPLHRVSADAAVPHWAVLTPDGKKAYTTNKTAPFVSVLDPTGERETRRIAVSGSEGLALSPDGARLFVATPALSLTPDPAAEYAMLVIDVGTDTVVHSFPTANAPSAVHVTSTGKLLVGQWRGDDGLLSIYDATTYEPLGHTEVGKAPLNICATPDGATGFVSNLMSGTVSVVDLDRCAVRATLAIDTSGDQGAHGIAYIPAG
ncbi:YncE family protein [Nocardia sp. NPDC050175]|uniref:YncE family protein n=1 Tax=Nocardia sp. NPDC050175 TaxID=3364317 RepID=UPI0037931AF2